MNISFRQKLLFFQSDFIDAVQNMTTKTQSNFLEGFLPVPLVLFILDYAMDVYELSHTKNHFSV